MVCYVQIVALPRFISSVKNEKRQIYRYIYPSKYWSSWADLNRRPHPYQGCALPLSYMSESCLLCPENLLQTVECESELERVAGIEPASSAWKAEVIATIPYPPKAADQDGGGRWIRTIEAFASDLQSDPFGHSGIPPQPHR